MTADWARTSVWRNVRIVNEVRGTTESSRRAQTPATVSGSKFGNGRGFGARHERVRHLHLHRVSLLDGACRVGERRQVAELKMPAVADRTRQPVSAVAF